MPNYNTLNRWLEAKGSSKFDEKRNWYQKDKVSTPFGSVTMFRPIYIRRLKKYPL